MVRAQPTLPVFHGLLFLSGFAGLGYEMVWARMLSVGLGHEIIAVLAVVAAFFGGLAFGAWALDARISRSRYPGRWYAALEAIIGLWALLLIALIPVANALAAHLIGVEPSGIRHWAVAFLLPFLLLLPATAAMGATLPAMERLVFRVRSGGRTVGGLYAANTFGAVAGTMLSTFWIAPAIGFSNTLIVLAAANLFCALAVLIGAGRRPWDVPEKTDHVADKRTNARSAPIADNGPRILITLFATGLIGIGYEVLIIRMLSQILENTVYSFASVLSVYLFGTALGGMAYQLWRRQSASFEVTLTGLLVALSLTCLGGLGLLLVAEPSYHTVRSALGDATVAGMTAEVVVATMVLILPTVVMGATFAHLGQRLRDIRDRLGYAVAINTAGGALAPLLFGVGVLPLLGAKAALLVASVVYLLLIPPGRGRRWAFAGIPAAVAVGLALAPLDFRFVAVPPGGDIIAHDEGVMAAVTVVRDHRDHLSLKVNDEFKMGSTASSYSDRRQAHVPLLLHPKPERALFLGLGTGATLAGVIDHPGLATTGVELVPEVVQAMPHFAAVLNGLLTNEQVQIIVADARRYAQATDGSYDVVVADVFHPSRDGAGSLYTVEHFAAVRDRLKPDGLFCQWLPLYQLQVDTLRTIIRTFLAVYPHATAHIAHNSLLTPMLCLVGSPAPLRFPTDWSARRLVDPHLEDVLDDLHLADPFALFGTFVAGPDALRRFSGDGPLNTDDHPIVTFEAPAAVYGEPEPPWGRLLAIIEGTDRDPADLLQLDARAPSDQRDPADVAERLAAYWHARDRFLEMGTKVTPSGDPREMVRQIGEPLLAIVRESPDFEPAYRPLLALARDLARVDPQAAGALLYTLHQANPNRNDARMLFTELFERPSPGRDGNRVPPAGSGDSEARP